MPYPQYSKQAQWPASGTLHGLSGRPPAAACLQCQITAGRSLTKCAASVYMSPERSIDSAWTVGSTNLSFCEYISDNMSPPPLIPRPLSLPSCPPERDRSATGMSQNGTLAPASAAGAAPSTRHLSTGCSGGQCAGACSRAAWTSSHATPAPKLPAKLLALVVLALLEELKSDESAGAVSDVCDAQSPSRSS